MKKIGFLSFGHWTPSPQSQTRSASDALLQSIDLAVAAEELGGGRGGFRVPSLRPPPPPARSFRPPPPPARRGRGAPAALFPACIPPPASSARPSRCWPRSAP